MNERNTLMSIQQTHQELTQEIWNFCFKYKLTLSEIHIIKRKNRQTVYSFQTLSLSYFTYLYSESYKIIEDKR